MMNTDRALGIFRPLCEESKSGSPNRMSVSRSIRTHLVRSLLGR